MEYLYDQVDPATIKRDDKMPMVEVKLDLIPVRVSEEGAKRDEVKFIPDLQKAGGKGLRDLVNNWVGSFFTVATQFKRLDNEGTYLREMHADHSIMMVMAGINETLEGNEDQCLAVKAGYDKHSYLWLTNMAEFFDEFKADAMITTPNGQRLIDLKKYDAAITKYENVRDSISQLPSPVDIGWIRINTSPAKSQLIMWTSRWIEMFTKHVKETIVEKLSTLNEFMGVVRDMSDKHVFFHFLSTSDMVHLHLKFLLTVLLFGSRSAKVLMLKFRILKKTLVMSSRWPRWRARARAPMLPPNRL